MRPRPGRRRLPLASTNLTLLLSIALLITFFAPTTAFNRPRFEIRRPALEEWENDIVFDPRPTPRPELVKRQFDLGSSSSRSRTSSQEEDQPTSTADDSPTSTSAQEATGSGGIISAPTPSDSDLPRPFDAGLGTNYTQPGCLTFLRNMLSDDAFTNCLPVSVLLQVCNHSLKIASLLTVPELSIILHRLSLCILPRSCPHTVLQRQSRLLLLRHVLLRPHPPLLLRLLPRLRPPTTNRAASLQWPRLLRPAISYHVHQSRAIIRKQ